MAIADRNGLPISLWVASATPHEQKLVAATVEHRFVAEKPKRLIADKGYDSDALDDQLAQHGIELIAPHRSLSHPHAPPRPAKTSTLQTAVENRGVLCLVEELSTPAGALGAS